jgi:hypothetical protein
MYRQAADNLHLLLLLLELYLYLHPAHRPYCWPLTIYTYSYSYSSSTSTSTPPTAHIADKGKLPNRPPPIGLTRESWQPAAKEKLAHVAASRSRAQTFIHPRQQPSGKAIREN